MGSCFSSSNSSSSSVDAPTAKVIALDGSLIEHSVSCPVSTVLKPYLSNCFLCDADSLYFDSYISPIGLNTLLLPEHIYFVLPISQLNSPLSGSDMAALAVKASAAIAARGSGSGRWAGRGKIRVMPVLDQEDGNGIKKRELGVCRPRRTNRLRLSTIQEGDHE